MVRDLEVGRVLRVEGNPDIAYAVDMISQLGEAYLKLLKLKHPSRYASKELDSSRYGLMKP
jgi:hypothetical protein